MYKFYENKKTFFFLILILDCYRACRQLLLSQAESWKIK